MTTPYQTYAKVYNVKDYGALGDNSHDDTANIQACIDAAIAANVKAIYIPGTQPGYKVSAPIFLDPPGNLRSSISSPTNFNFSLSLFGSPGLPNHNGYGTILRPVTNDFVVLWVGPGQSMMVSDINIWHISSTYNGDHPTTGVGFAVSGGPGGASNTKFLRCGVEQFYYGFKCDAAELNSLADSNSFQHCKTESCYIGYRFAGSQVYINNIDDCGAHYCTIGVRADVGMNVNIRGGNYSNVSARKGVYTIGSISALVGSSTGAVTDYSFDAVVTSPGTNFTNIYDAFVIKTAHFGNIPCRKTAWNSGTNTITLRISEHFTIHNFGRDSTAATTTDLEADIQACTKLYAIETITTFWGSGLNIDGVHIENPIAYNRFFYGRTGFSGGKSSIKNVRFNYYVDSGYSDEYGEDSEEECVFLNQQCHPFIELHNCPSLTIENWESGTGNSWDNALLTMSSPCDLSGKNIDTIGLNIRYQGSSGADPLDGGGLYRGVFSYGVGEWDKLTFRAPRLTPDSSEAMRMHGMCSGPARGYIYQPHVIPKLKSSHYTIVSGDLSAVTLGSYPLIFGQQAYQLYGLTDTTGAKFFVKSRHKGWSYGKNLTVNWEHRGKANVLYVDDFTYLFNGLSIGVNNGTDGLIYYVIVGMYPTFGYVQVHRMETGSANIVLAGNKTTDYSGSTLYQEVYDFDTVP